ncbi:MAG: DUF2066 domain-containing protein [Gammaproteobacteria bacterium]|nr:DUF2066 domain-containing protein [Gammaproteobacteria bacterium]MCW5583893.1 DUF2066 domain-containing protein [Gammaproteobacteria bacterium]
MLNMRKRLFIAFLMAFFFPITPALAVKVVNLYQASISVISQSGDIKEQAIKEGFLEVLIKVSGDPQIDKNPIIRASLKKAEYYVQEYSYSLATPDSSQYLLQILYERNDVDRLLRKANVAYWGENRPLVLVWLVVTNQERDADIVTHERPSGIYASIRQESKKFGLPLIFPMMDVDEVNQVSPNDITVLSMSTLKKAAKRYSPDALLIGEITEHDQNVQSQWQLVMSHTQWSWKIDKKTTSAVIASIIKRVNQVMMRRSGALSKNSVKQVSEELPLHITPNVIRKGAVRRPHSRHGHNQNL